MGLLALWAMLAPTAVNGADSPVAWDTAGCTIVDKWVEPDIIHSNERITFTIRIRNEIAPCLFGYDWNYRHVFFNQPRYRSFRGRQSSGEVDFTNEDADMGR